MHSLQLEVAGCYHERKMKAPGTVKKAGVGMKTGCMTPTVSIIVVNWNGWRDTLECVESLYQIEYPIYHVIVVDNGSRTSLCQESGSTAKNRSP